MYTWYKILQEQGGVNPAPAQPAPAQAQPAPAQAQPQPAQAQPAAQPTGTAARQYKIIAPDATYVVTYIVASKGWCVYRQQPGATKAQLVGQPMKTLQDAFASVAVGL